MAAQFPLAQVPVDVGASVSPTTGRFVVDIGAGGGGGGNTASSATGGAVPASGSYSAVNVSGTLTGQTGASLAAGAVVAGATAVYDSAGNQISNFGNNTDLATSGTLSAAQATLAQTSTNVANSTVVLPLGTGQQSFAVSLTGTITTSVITVDGSVDSSASTTKWIALPFLVFGTTSQVTSVTLASQSILSLYGACAGLAQIRVRMSTHAGSDSIVALVRASLAPAAAGAVNTNTITPDQPAATTVSWTSATSSTTTQTLNISGHSVVAISYGITGASITGGTIDFAVTDDGGTNWYQVSATRVNSATQDLTWPLAGSIGAQNAWQINVSGFTQIRVRLTVAITGSGTAVISMQKQALGSAPNIVVGQATATNLQMTPNGVYNSSPPSLTNGASVPFQTDIAGRLLTSDRLLTSQDQVTLAGGNVNANVQLFDSNNAGLRAVTPSGGINQLQINGCEAVQIANWNTQVITAQITYGPLNVRNFRELLIVFSMTAHTTGFTVFYQIIDGNGTPVTVWSETFSTDTIQCISVGRGYTGGTARGISLGLSGQLCVVGATSGTIKGSAWLRTN